MKKSIKKHLKLGCIIITKSGEIYKVTELLERKFKCKPLPVLPPDIDYIQEFYYNIEMTICKVVASNVSITNP